MKSQSMPLPLYLGLIFAIVYGFYQYRYSQTERTVTFIVQDKAIKTSGGGKEAIKSVYMIYTSAGVFKNEDDWLRSKYNSSDVYNQFRVGHTYTAVVIGWRSPFFSMYPNILRASQGIPPGGFELPAPAAIEPVGEGNTFDAGRNFSTPVVLD
ncbi:hypothetical protein [Spirosoma fluminis]